MRGWEGVHTCHDECPCRTGGEPMADFSPAELRPPMACCSCGESISFERGLIFGVCGSCWGKALAPKGEEE